MRRIPARKGGGTRVRLVWLGMMILVLGGCDELGVEARPGDLDVKILSDTSGMVGTTTLVDLLIELDGVDLTGVRVRWEPIDSTAIAVLAGANSSALMDATSLDTLDATLFAEVTFLRRGTHDLLVHVDSVGIDAVETETLTFEVEERWQSVSAGENHTCAVTYGDTLSLGLRPGGEGFCWGFGFFGALGTGFSHVVQVPTRVASDVLFADVRAGIAYSCATDRIGLLHCWGDNFSGQLGLGNDLDQFIPRLIALGEAFGLFDVSLGPSYFTCGVRGLASSPAGSGSTLCWGDNFDGQLGCGTTNPPCDPSGLKQPNTALGSAVRTDSIDSAGFEEPAFSSLSLGSDHACGVADGDVLCWGSSQYGQLGVPFATDMSEFAIPIQGGLSFAEVAAGGSLDVLPDPPDYEYADGGFACGLNEDFSGVHCWGRMGAFGSMSSTPVAVSGLAAGPLSALTAGGAHACVLDPQGDAYCWGANGHGQLGDGTLDPSDMAAVPVVQPVVQGQRLSFVILSAGTIHTCAITDEALIFGGSNMPDVDPPGSGAIYCWGSDDAGQLGNGTSVGASSVPLRVVEPDP